MKISSGALSNAMWMAASTGLRLASGLLVFVFLARQLGVEAFGQRMIGMAVAGIVAMPCNYGLTFFLLNRGPRCDDGGFETLERLLGLKLILFLICLAIMVPVLSFMPVLPAVAFELLVMHVAESFTELLCVRMRVIGSFGKETKFVSAQACIQFFVVFIFALAFANPVGIAGGFMASRLIGLVVALFYLRPLHSAIPVPKIAGAKDLLREARPFFLDFSSQSALTQLDSVLLGYYSSGLAVGLYQAGMKLIQGVSQAISIMVNVALPKLAVMSERQQITRQVVTSTMGLFAATGLILAAPFYFFPTWLASTAFGSSFAGLGPILAWMALFLVVRFTAAASGMLLVALNEQGSRATVMAIAVVILVLASSIFMPRYGAVGAVFSMLAAYTFILISLSTIMLRKSVKNTSKEKAV
jgi:O-antigen/teichoic acid export membrane protein